MASVIHVQRKILRGRDQLLAQAHALDEVPEGTGQPCPLRAQLQHEVPVEFGPHDTTRNARRFPDGDVNA